MTRISCLTAAALLAAGCAAKPSDAIESVSKSHPALVRPALGAQFQLRVGQSAIVVRKVLKLGFETVAADSRCGKGETCVWEGDAIVRLWLQGVDGSKQRRELHSASRLGSTATFESYTIRLITLDPTRIAGHSIPPAAYLATLVVTRGLMDDDPSH